MGRPKQQMAVKAALENSCTDLNFMLYLVLASLLVYFLFCAFPDFIKLEQENYLYKDTWFRSQVTVDNILSRKIGKRSKSRLLFS